MNNIQKCQEAEKQGLRVQHGDGLVWITCNYLNYDDDDCFYRIHPDDLHKFIDPDIKTENPEKILEKSSEFLENSSEILTDSTEFMEILTNLPEIVTDFQKTLLKSSKDFKFSCETQGDSIKIEVLIQKNSVKQEESNHEEWISNVGNKRGGGSDCVDLEDDMLLDVVYRSGYKEKIRHGDTSYISWQDNDLPSDIIKFRILK
jgi:hypothetical protein